MELAQNDNATNNAEPGAFKDALHLTAEALRVLLPRLGFFLKTTLLIFVPLELLVYLSNTWIPDSTGGAIVVGMTEFILYTLGMVLYYPAALYCYVRTKDGHSAPALTPALRYALGRFPRLAVFSAAYTLVTLVGLLLLLVPGVYWSVRYSFGAVIASARPASLTDTFAQSKALTQGRFGRVLAVVFVSTVCAAILATVLYTAVFLIFHLTLRIPFSEFTFDIVYNLLMIVPFLALVLLYERLTGEPIDLAS